MMPVLAAVFALSLIGVVGDFVLYQFRFLSGSGAGQRWPVAFALGSGCVTLLLFFASWLMPARATTITGVVVTVLVLVQGNRRRGAVTAVIKTWRTAPPPPRQMLPGLFTGLFFIFVALAALALDFGHDGFFYAMKAKIIYLNGGWPPLDEAHRATPHLDYPLLVPALEYWVYAFVGGINEQAAKIVFVFFFASLVTLFYDAVRTFYPPFLAFVFTALLALTPQLVTVSAISGYVDVPLMLYLFAAFIFLFRWIQDGQPASLILGAILAALAVWVKREGYVYWVISLALFLVFWARAWRFESGQRRRRFVLLYLLPALLIVGPWLLYLHLNGIENTDFVPLTGSGFIENLERTPIIAERLLRHLFVRVEQWGLLWYLFAFVTLWRQRQLRTFDAFFNWMLVAGPVILLSASFIFSNWEPFTLHMDVSLERLLLHTIPMAWFFIGWQTREMKEWFAAQFSS